jgi:site-specific recombinase XerD
MLENLVEKADDLHGYIFQDADGGPISYEAMRYQIGKACENANVEYRGQHVFRHTFATNCYKNGADVKILSKLLGHSSVAITYNTYIHLYGDALEEMRSVVA